MSDVTIRLERKAAKKLLEAMRKGVWNKLTPAQCSALEDFIVELEIETGGA